MNSIIISLIIPCYNVEKYVLSALYSTWENVSPSLRSKIEWIIINDGSRDQTPILIEQFIHEKLEAHQTHYHYIQQDNAGLSMARNIGMQYASGKYYLFLDSDDLLIHHAIDKILDCIEQHQPQIIEFDAKVFEKEEEIQINPHQSLYQTYFQDIHHQNHQNQKKIQRAFEENRWYVWSRCYHRNVFKNHQFEQGKLFEDMMIIPYLYLEQTHITHIVSLPETLIAYRQNPQSITGNIQHKHILDLAYSLEKAIESEKIYIHHQKELSILQMKIWRLMVAFAVKKYLKTKEISYLNLIRQQQKSFHQKYQRHFSWQINYFTWVLLKRLLNKFLMVNQKDKK